MNYFCQKVKPESNQALSYLSLQKILIGNRFKFVKCHHGDAISKTENMRNLQDKLSDFKNWQREGGGETIKNCKRFKRLLNATC